MRKRKSDEENKGASASKVIKTDRGVEPEEARIEAKGEDSKPEPACDNVKEENAESNVLHFSALFSKIVDKPGHECFKHVRCWFESRVVSRARLFGSVPGSGLSWSNVSDLRTNLFRNDGHFCRQLLLKKSS